MSKIVILVGSVRRNGNTELLAKAFADGAGKQNEVKVVSVADYRVNSCKGCNCCYTSEGNQCVQNDDMTEIYNLLAQADTLVIASPVYFYGVSAQLKALIDRLHTPMRNHFNIKRLGLILVGAATIPDLFEPITMQYRMILRFFGLEDIGTVLVSGAKEKGDVLNGDGIKRAYEMGINLQYLRVCGSEQRIHSVSGNRDKLGREESCMKKALVVIDIQNDITRHYRDIIDKLNTAVSWAEESGMEIVYIQHNNLSAGTRTFKPGTKGAELVPELRIVSDHIFVKTKANALTSEKFSEFIRAKDIREFYITGADATGCVKSTCFNMTKAGYAVHVISDCVTSYDLKKIDEMLAYYAEKGCEVKPLAEYRK